MLHITRNIEIKLREKISGRSSHFIKGLFIAFVLHLTLFLLIRIVSPPNLDAPPALLPISVEIDLTEAEVALVPPAASNPFPITACEHHFQRMPTCSPQKKPFSPFKPQSEDPDFSAVECMPYQIFEVDDV